MRGRFPSVFTASWDKSSMLHTTTRAKKKLVNSNELDCCARVNFLQNNHNHSWEFPGLFSLFSCDPAVYAVYVSFLVEISRPFDFNTHSCILDRKRLDCFPSHLTLPHQRGSLGLRNLSGGRLNLISYGRTGIWVDLSQVDHMSFRVVKSLWAVKRRASDEVPRGLVNVRRLMNKQDEGLFWKSRIWVSCFEAAKRPGKIPSL